MLATTATSMALWQVIFYPALSLFIAAVLAVFAGLPVWKKMQQQRKAHEQRVASTCDAVLGKEPDPNVGRFERSPGLVDTVPMIQKAIGPMNGKSIMGHIEDIEHQLKQLKGS